MKYMRSNFGYKLTLEFLATHVHLSREYLSRYFKEYTGKTISEFLLEIRMSRAMEMLRTSSYSVADIGAYCGYPSVTNFQKAFKKFVSMPPSVYRKRYKTSNKLCKKSKIHFNARYYERHERYVCFCTSASYGV